LVFVENAIVDKLRKQLNHLPINDEARVLYIMAEIRKLMEHAEHEKYKLLGFYCNWVLHIEMTRAMAKQILDELEKRDRIKNYDFVSFNRLKNELQEFLTSYHLPIEIITDKKMWSAFRRNLIEILIDSPLRNPVGEMIQFHFFKDPISPERSLSFQMTFPNNVTYAETIIIDYD
jgi:hypothetical protein